MFKLNIHTKLFIAFFFACLFAILIVLGIFRSQFQAIFMQYLDEQENKRIDTYSQVITDYYKNVGSLELFREHPYDLHYLLYKAATPNKFQRKRKHPPPILRLVILDHEKEELLGFLHNNETPKNLQSVEHQGKVIAYIGSYPRTRIYTRINQGFIDRLNGLLWVAGLVALLLTALFAFMVSRLLVQPIQRLSSGTHQLIQGKYGTYITPSSQDELGQLTRDFNELSSQLKAHEESRQQWIMDIAHELRTPLSILRGEIEAIQDGISQADETTIHSLHQEVLHLTRLVEDLYQLSMSDTGALSYQKQALNITELLHECVDNFSSALQQKEIQLLNTDIGQDVFYIHADKQRLQQLFQNIIKNTLRYTDSPGQLHINLSQQQGWLTISFEDSAPSVPDNALPKLFDRLYRVENSRNRATGGAGIGLSLCANIVKAHHGEIHAEHSKLGGLAIKIKFPLSMEG